MIFGIGTDIVSIPRMAQGLERYGERFAGRILAEQELHEFRQSGNPAAFLAKRFAAKEAAVKALGVGFRDGVSLHHIRVDHDSLGKPLLVLTGKAQDLALEMGIGESYLSLADERETAIAFVTLMRRN